jgi:hypothetical protein
VPEGKGCCSWSGGAITRCRSQGARHTAAVCLSPVSCHHHLQQLSTADSHWLYLSHMLMHVRQQQHYACWLEGLPELQAPSAVCSIRCTRQDVLLFSGRMLCQMMHCCCVAACGHPGEVIQLVVPFE